jgi:signal transduction histidine kinase
MTLRSRILITLVPLWTLLAVLGAAGVILLWQLGNRIGVILHENYDSVLYMERLHEALERIDSSFQFTLAGRVDKGKKQYDEQWPVYRDFLKKEQGNITLPGEKELVDKLNELTDRYRQQGDAFYRSTDPAEMARAYFPDGKRQETLFGSFEAIKDTAAKILELNQTNMEEASANAKKTAAASVFWFGGGFLISALAAVFLAGHTLQTIVEPIRSLRAAAQGIATGDLDQVLPSTSVEELAELSKVFNSMARHLRDARRSQGSRLQRVERTSQATIDSFPDPVLVLDTEGRVEMANPAARKFLGVSPRHDDQATSGTWAPPDSLRQPLTDALQGRSNFLPDGFERALYIEVNGQTRTVLPRILTIHDRGGDLLGAAVLLQDITRLRVLDDIKTNLVATVSHELKTPLTGIRLAVHLLLEEVVGPLTSKQTELLLDARDHSERLLKMVENLLNLARFESGRRQLEMSSQQPRLVLQTAADNIAARAQDKGITVEVHTTPGLPDVLLDQVRFQTALGNLLDNALAYTDRGGRITLAADAKPEGVEFSVSDTGIGIPEDSLPHVFEKFFRVPGQSRHGGTGLGLAIVQEVVVAHGGTVTCESRLGEGTTFRITLPLATAFTSKSAGNDGARN